MKQPTTVTGNKLEETTEKFSDIKETFVGQRNTNNLRAKKVQKVRKVEKVEKVERVENFEDDTDEDTEENFSRDFAMKAPGVPEISQELVNQLVEESSKSGPVNSTLLGTATSVFNFEPNDDSTHSGATLDSAFDKPVPESTKTDVVDLNRNNVTNYNAKDYLPKEINDDWFNTDFSQAKYKMNDDKLINVDKYIIGINTVGQSLKNASYDIRGSVNVAKYTVSPWNNSTIEPDYNIKPLC